MWGCRTVRLFNDIDNWLIILQMYSHTAIWGPMFASTSILIKRLVDGKVEMTANKLPENYQMGKLLTKSWSHHSTPSACSGQKARPIKSYFTHRIFFQVAQFQSSLNWMPQIDGNQITCRILTVWVIPKNMANAMPYLSFSGFLV